MYPVEYIALNISDSLFVLLEYFLLVWIKIIRLNLFWITKSWILVWILSAQTASQLYKWSENIDLHCSSDNIFPETVKLNKPVQSSLDRPR